MITLTSLAVSLLRVCSLGENRCCSCRGYSSDRSVPHGPEKGMGSVYKTAHWLRGHGAGHRLVDLGNTTRRREVLFRTNHSVFLFCHSLLAELGVNRLLPTTV